MRVLFVFGLALAIQTPLVFAGGSQTGPLVNALGGGFASRGMARPLGGISSGPQHRGNGNGRAGSSLRAPLALPYAYSYYIPGYSDFYGADAQGASYGYPPADAPPAAAPQPPPVIINQYFSAPPLQQLPQAEPPAADPQAADQRPGDPIGQVDNYYLIAYKNHSVYAALAYWLEDGTLHYVTTENTHNQASLNLIDLDLTKTLNQARSVQFSLPGR